LLKTRLDILAYRIKFASNHKVVALSSRLSNLRGKEGRAIIDEAVFHDDLSSLMKAAMVFTMWGGRVHVMSTTTAPTILHRPPDARRRRPSASLRLGYRQRARLLRDEDRSSEISIRAGYDRISFGVDRNEEEDNLYASLGPFPPREHDQTAEPHETRAYKQVFRLGNMTESTVGDHRRQ
jgi:hypothetical protein